MSKSAEAFRTISEVADELEIAKHVLRFWENRFPQIKPMKRGGGRRYYRPEDMELLRGIRHLLHNEGYTIRGVQKILRQQGVETVKACWKAGAPAVAPDGEASAKVVGTRNGARHADKASAGRSARGGARSAGDPSALLFAAIKELEACRDLLAGEGGTRTVKGGAGRRRTKAGA